MERKKSNSWWMLAGVLLATVLMAACSGSGVTNPGGDQDPGVCGAQAVSCSADAECGPCKVCDKVNGCCVSLPCEATTDCDVFAGEGAYCLGGSCYCPNADGDGESDGDEVKPDGDQSDRPALCTDPSMVDFGAVQLAELTCVEFTMFNCGEGVLEVNSIVLLQDGVPSGSEEITPGGDVPAENNIVYLGSGDEHKMEFCYTPANPGEDSGRILVGTNAGTKTVNWLSREKGVPKIEVECEQLDPDYIPPYEEYKDACSFGLVPVGESRTMNVTIRNIQDDADSNAVLQVSEIFLRDPEDPDNRFVTNFQVDPSTIEWQEDLREIWLGPNTETSFTLVYAPQTREFHALNIEFTHNDNRPDVPQPAIVTVVGAGTMGELSVRPSPIAIGAVQVGMCKTATVSLSNVGLAGLDIAEAKLDASANLNVFSVDLDPDADMENNIPAALTPTQSDEDSWKTEVGVTCCPQGNETYASYLNLISNHLAQSRALTQIPITCGGIMPRCMVGPPVLEFPCQRVMADSVYKSIEITNNGGASARVEEIILTGDAGFSIQGGLDLPIDVAPGNILYIDVYFQALHVGQAQGEVTVIFSSGTCEETTIPLKGCGMQPQLGIPGCTEWVDQQVPPDPPSGLTPQEEAEWIAATKDEWLEWKPIQLSNTGSETLEIYDIFVPSAFQSLFEVELIGGLPGILPPTGRYGFDVRFTPTGFGQYNGVVVVCSNTAGGSGSGYVCDQPGAVATEICVTGNAITPGLFVEPSVGTHAWRNVLVEEGPTDAYTVTIRNVGRGPVQIDSVEMAYGDPEIFISAMTYAGNPILGNFPADGIALLQGEENKIIVSVKCDPTGATTYRRSLDITHNDRSATKPDPQNPSELISMHPVYHFDFTCSAGENAPPTAIVKSPANDPPGPYGTRSISVSRGDEIFLYGTSSYDIDHDPDGGVLDPITYYEWSASDENKVMFTSETEGANVSIASARFNYNGQYTISLRVRDSHSTWSNPSFRDSQLVVNVTEGPVAIGYECDDAMTYLNVETGTTVCLDGTSSYDPDAQAGETLGYMWYIKKVGGDKMNFSTSAKPNYTFNETGDFEIELYVTDADGLRSEYPAVIDAHVYADESLRIELTWTGQGDVDLHYIKPNGYMNSIGDCNVGNPNPNWQQFGHPQFQQGSTNGVSPEVIVHPDPGDGPPAYTVAAVYENPSQTCGNESETRFFEKNCDICGCDCKPFCLLLRICCMNCTETITEWVCHDNPAPLVYKMFMNDQPYPKCTVTGSTVKVDEEGDIHSFQMQRVNGGWYCP